MEVHRKRNSSQQYRSPCQIINLNVHQNLPMAAPEHRVHNRRRRHHRPELPKMGRSSSPKRTYHTQWHKICCLKTCDSMEDFVWFSQFIREFESSDAEPWSFLDITDTVSGAISPPWIPRFVQPPRKHLPGNNRRYRNPATKHTAAHQQKPHKKEQPNCNYHLEGPPDPFVYLVPMALTGECAFSQFLQKYQPPPPCYFHCPQICHSQLTTNTCSKACPVHSWVPGYMHAPMIFPATNMLQQLSHHYVAHQH